MKTLVIFLLLASAAIGKDIPRSRRYHLPPAPHEPGIWKPSKPGPFTYRGERYANFEAFKRSKAYADYLFEIDLAALEFDRRLARKEADYVRVITFSRRWHAMRASTQATVTMPRF